MPKLWLILRQTGDDISAHSAYNTKEACDNAYQKLSMNLSGDFDEDGVLYYTSSVEAPKRQNKASKNKDFVTASYMKLQEKTRQGISKFLELKKGNSNADTDIYVKVNNLWYTIDAIYPREIKDNKGKQIGSDIIARCAGFEDGSGGYSFIYLNSDEESIKWDTLYVSTVPPENDWSGLIDTESNEGWLSPDGKFYGCEYQGHYRMAKLLFKKEDDELEAAGWIKISHEAFSDKVTFRVNRYKKKSDRLTSAQRNYLLARPEAEAWIQDIMTKDYLLK